MDCHTTELVVPLRRTRLPLVARLSVAVESAGRGGEVALGPSLVPGMKVKVKVLFGEEDHLEFGFEAESVEPSGISSASEIGIKKMVRIINMHEHAEDFIIFFFV
ncbi:hypothetical protein LIER_17606 [Lithospermum erythrorhizon]|uniref:Uncharacterized protein n=1 Tax=Lithospermum erythrorhizon TaxID=34254 RepID=A0AAV3QDC3_LITER